MKISVVIPAHNASATIVECLNALSCQTLARTQYELIVVDDGSDDNTADLAAGVGVKVLRQPRRGPSAARNAGIQLARGEIICFTDADCAPKQDWLQQLSAVFQDRLIVGCKGTYATRQTQPVARFVQLEYEDKYDLLKSQEQIDFIDTYSAAYRREVLVANDGFDEQFEYVEDQELSFRLAARGYRMVFQPDAVVYHYHSRNLQEYFQKKLRIGFWKAQVVRRFPERGVRDSHTPQVMKVQMALVAVMLATLFAAPIIRGAILVTAAAVLIFLATALPFLAKVRRRSPAIALIAPLMLIVRALALGLGYTWGSLQPRRGISGYGSTIGGMRYILKRLIDVIGGMAGLLLVFLIGPFIALAIKVGSRGPVLFKQERIGRAGRPFTIYKFRSMRSGAETELARFIDLDSLGQPAFKLDRDPRVTGVGRILRRWSLDELPQFWNVVRGDMSLVGPRPEEAQLVARYSDWHRRRLSVKPGMTGPMQINGRGDLPLDARIKLELDYIDHYSLSKDFAILARTIPAVLKGQGAR